MDHRHSQRTIKGKSYRRSQWRSQGRVHRRHHSHRLLLSQSEACIIWWGREYTDDLSFITSFFEVWIPRFLSSLSFFVYGLFPMILFFVFFRDISKQRFHRLLKREHRFVRLLFFLVLVLLIFSFSIGFIFDFNQAISQRAMTGPVHL
jgi:hypothetical protein